MTDAMTHEEAARIERDLLRALGVIRDHWAALTQPSSAGTGVGGKSADEVTGLDRRVSLRHEVTLCLNGWARIVVEENDLTHHLPLGTDTLGLIELLERWARWFSGHEAAPDATVELSAWARRVRDVVLGHTVSRFRVARCPEMVWPNPDEMERCPGELWVVMRRSTQMLPQVIGCDKDAEHAWTPHEWAALGRRIYTLDGVGLSDQSETMGA